MVRSAWRAVHWQRKDIFYDDRYKVGPFVEPRAGLMRNEHEQGVPFLLFQHLVMPGVWATLGEKRA